MTPHLSIALGLLLLAAPLHGAPGNPASSLDPGLQGRTCGTPDAAPQDMAQVETALRRWSDEHSLLGTKGGGTVRVAFHVITSGRQGQVSDAQIAEQIAELNRGYRRTGYRFVLASVDRTENSGWFKMVPGSGTERNAKQTLAVDPAHHLNVYTCGPGALLLGWAYFPWSLPEDHFLHGVVVHYASLPGGELARYNLGRTTTHEVGHYLGLLHTFQGGCTAPGDFVDDTPFEAVPSFGCPEGRNTCPDPEPDPIHNFMDYSDDACMTEFTSGQDGRMDAIVPVYRPSLFSAVAALAHAGAEIAADATDPADLSRALEFRGAGPNPFRSQTAVRFMLPRSAHVSLRVYNVTGQLVRTLMDAPLPAGAHSALFAGRDLPAGLYFLQLKVGATVMNRSVIRLR